MLFEGRAWRYGDNVDTDLIIPARYLNITSVEELAKHCLEGLDPVFAREARPGDILVVGENFGCGSSREHAPLAIKALGISCILAKSFARIFFRNAINLGLPVVECPHAGQVEQGDLLRVDLKEGFVRNLTKGETYEIAPYPAFVREIIVSGGLITWAKTRKRKEV